MNNLENKILDESNIDVIRMNQPTININMLGHVSNGKSSLTYQLTQTKTQRYSTEQQRNITIKLGYANAKIFKCDICPAPECYKSYASDKMEAKCLYCDLPMKLMKHVSFVDSPGHYELMHVMLNGTSVAHSTIIVESVSNLMIPAPQTKEHIEAANIIKLPNVMVCMNKIDLVDKSVAEKRIVMLRNALKDTIAENSPIVPISANFDINIDVVSQYICENIPEPEKDLVSSVKMIITRSFNINKPNTLVKNIKGGVIGGSIIRGLLRLGDKVKILPGIIKNKDNKWNYYPLIAHVLSINSENNKLQCAVPGGLIGVETTLDSAVTASDRIIGSVLEKFDDNSDNKVYDTIYVLLELKASYDKDISNEKKIIINHNGCDILCELIKCKFHKKLGGLAVELRLMDRPIYATPNDYITINRITSNSNSYSEKKYSIELIGRGKIIDGEVGILIDNFVSEDL